MFLGIAVLYGSLFLLNDLIALFKRANNQRLSYLATMPFSMALFFLVESKK